MESIILSCQINDECIAVTDEVSSGSILIVNNECLTYTLDKARIINRMEKIIQMLKEAYVVKTRFSDRAPCRDGLRVSDTRDSTIIYYDGEKAVLKDGELYVTRRFKLEDAIDSFNKLRSIPEKSPTFEGTWCRARYLKDGNLVIINSPSDCLVFDLSSLDSKINKIAHCLVNAIAHCDVTYIARNNTLQLYTADDTPLMEVTVDDPIRHYLNLSVAVT